MRIFFKGFNLYNQLNGEENCIAEFTPTMVVDDILCLEIKHTYSLFFSNNALKIYSKFAPSDTLEYPNIKISQISANDHIIIILSNLGQLYKTTIDSLNEIEPLPRLIEEDDKIKLIRCGSKLNIVYTERGLLYTIPEKLDFTNPDIIDIQTGHEHCLLLDKMGNVYSYGRGRYSYKNEIRYDLHNRGQLGHGQLDDESYPKLVEALAGIKISNIASGGWHSAAISHEGDLYTWGWNGNGQLGLLSSTVTLQEKSVSVMATPHVIDIEGCLENPVIKIACGNKHTIILLDNNGLFGSGWNKYKQLKNEEQENYYSFILLHTFSGERVKDITCGPWNTAVICK